MTRRTPPPALVSELRRLTALELSSSARTGYVMLLLTASAMTAVVAALLVTERDLPLRTSAALVMMTLIGLSWTAFAGWVLGRKRILLGKQSVVAGRMAMVFTALFTLGAVVVDYSTTQPAARWAGGLGVLMLGGAVVMWVRARRNFIALSNRRQALQRDLGEIA